LKKDHTLAIGSLMIEKTMTGKAFHGAT
jgi:hypothetical protein